MPDKKFKTMLSPKYDTEMPEGENHQTKSINRSQATFWELKHNAVMKKNNQQLRWIKKLKTQ